MVAKGDSVKLGQRIAASTDFSVAPIHSSVSGIVSDVMPWPDPRGNKVLSIVIDSDGRDEWVEGVEPNEQFLSERPSKLISTLRFAGITEAGMNGVPLHVNLTPPEQPKSYLFLVGIPVLKRVHTLLVNGVDAEPNVFVRRAVLHNFTRELVLGIQVIRRITGVGKVVLALSEQEAYPSEVIDPLRKAGVGLFWASDKYPSALEPILVKQFTGEEIPLPGGNSRDVGVLVQDVVTLVNVVTAVRDGKPLVDKLVTVAGQGLSRPRNVRVRVGTSVKEMLAQMQIDSTNVHKVLLGGGMMGFAQYTLDVPITKEVYAVHLQGKDQVERFAPEPCFNCGECVSVCPVNLLPNELSKFCEFGRFDDAERNLISHCIECGLCAYVCPVKRPMVHFMRYGKSEIIARKVSV